MSYAIVKSFELKLQELRKELNILKKSEPSEENLAQVRKIERNARELTNAIRAYKLGHGLAA